MIADQELLICSGPSCLAFEIIRVPDSVPSNGLSPGNMLSIIATNATKVVAAIIQTLAVFQVIMRNFMPITVIEIIQITNIKTKTLKKVLPCGYFKPPGGWFLFVFVY